MRRSKWILTSLLAWLVFTVPSWAEVKNNSTGVREPLIERHVAPLLS